MPLPTDSWQIESISCSIIAMSEIVAMPWFDGIVKFNVFLQLFVVVFYFTDQLQTYIPSFERN